MGRLRFFGLSALTWVAAVMLLAEAGATPAPSAIIVKRVPRDEAPGLSALKNGDLERVERGVGARESTPAAPADDGTPDTAQSHDRAPEAVPADRLRFVGAEEWELGYEVDADVRRSGRYSARCASAAETEQHGILFVIELNQERATPIRAECWSKAEGVTGSADGGYSLYLDITYADGAPLWGQVRQFATGTHDWEKAVVTVMPAKPIREVRVHGLLRGHQGTAWFDDFALWELRPKGEWSVFDGILVEQGRGAASSSGEQVANLCPPNGGGVDLAFDTATGRIVREGRFGGLYVRDVAAESDFRQPLGQVVRTPDGGLFFSGEDSTLGLSLTAEYSALPDHVRVRGTVKDLSGRDRAVTVYLALPLDARGWRWGRSLRAEDAIDSSGDYQVAVNVAGGTGHMARYPFAVAYPAPVIAPSSVTADASQGSAQTGWAIGYPLGVPRINRVGYNAASRELYAAVDLGLSGATTRSPQEASFEFIIYTFDPEWGMRSALARYYAIFPDAFVKRVEREGMWMPFTDIASVQGWQDFGFAFKEGTDNVPFDSANGIYSFVYVEPVSYWMAMPKDAPRTREAAEALLREKAQAGPNTTYAAATYTSIIRDANDTPVMHLIDAPWCDGALFILNPAPSVPVTDEYGINKAQAMFRQVDEAVGGQRWPLREWRAWDQGFTIEPGVGPDGETALRCESAAGMSAGAGQTVVLSPPRQEPILARAWSKADGVTGVADANYSVYLDLVYADGTPGYAFIASFAPGTHDWQMAEVRIDPPKPVAQISFYMLLRAPHIGRAWFARPELLMGAPTVGQADGEGIYPHPDLSLERRGVAGPELLVGQNPAGDTDTRENLLANPGFEASTGPAPSVSGTYIDSMEMSAEYLNFRREHWRDVSIPLVFDRVSGRCAQAEIFGTYEFLQECSRLMHEQGKLMFANGALWNYIQFAPLLDVMGTETNWLQGDELRLESDEVMTRRRALCYQKPYCLLMNSDYTKFPREYTERYFRHCLFYGIFPGFFSHNAADNPYWAQPALYNRDRELFKRYMPLIQEIAQAGWQPVTCARSDDEDVWVERYGPGTTADASGPVYLTVVNAGKQPKRARVTVDLNALQLPQVSASELLSGHILALTPAAGGSSSFEVDLAPEEAWVVRISATLPAP